jgi:hypothetical protein
VEFTAGGNTTTDGGKVSGSLETKYAIKEHGLKLTEKWTTDNSLATTVDYDKVAGLKLTLDSTFKPDTGDKVTKPFCLIVHFPSSRLERSRPSTSTRRPSSTWTATSPPPPW